MASSNPWNYPYAFNYPPYAPPACPCAYSPPGYQHPHLYSHSPPPLGFHEPIVYNHGPPPAGHQQSGPVYYPRTLPAHPQSRATDHHSGPQQVAAPNHIVGFQELAALNQVLGYQPPVPLGNTQSLSRQLPTTISAVSRSPYRHCLYPHCQEGVHNSDKVTPTPDSLVVGGRTYVLSSADGGTSPISRQGPDIHNGRTLHFSGTVNVALNGQRNERRNFTLLGTLDAGKCAVERNTQPRRLLQEPTAPGSADGVDKHPRIRANSVPVDDVQGQGYNSDPRQGSCSPRGLGVGCGPTLASQQAAYQKSHPGHQSDHSVAPKPVDGVGTPVFHSTGPDRGQGSTPSSVQYADDRGHTPNVPFDASSVCVDGENAPVPPLGNFTASNLVGGAPEPVLASNSLIGLNTAVGAPNSSSSLGIPEPGLSSTSFSNTLAPQHTASQGEILAASSNHPLCQQAAGDENASIHPIGDSTAHKPTGRCRIPVPPPKSSNPQSAICAPAPQPDKVATTQDAHAVNPKQQPRSRTSTTRSSRSSMAASNVVNQDQRSRRASAITAEHPSQQLQAARWQNDAVQSSTAASEKQSVTEDKEKENISYMEDLGPRKKDEFETWKQPGLVRN
ncbi:MAG: hypothetical protein LQ343_006747 [Gyalolechia ehrenbergii]|nr:MAG: hypothetical protein LQ343_006747 [Gyalolechia ehrenbergii]